MLFFIVPVFCCKKILLEIERFYSFQTNSLMKVNKVDIRIGFLQFNFISFLMKSI